MVNVQHVMTDGLLHSTTHICVCMWVCLCVCMSVCLSVCMCVCFISVQSSYRNKRYNHWWWNRN